MAKESYSVTLKADSVIGESDSMAAEVNQWPGSLIRWRGSQLTSGRANLARAGEPIWLACVGEDFLT